MNITRSLSLILASVFSCHGEIFISSTNQVTSLTIFSNEALLISAARQSPGFNADFKTYITIAGVDLPFRFDVGRRETRAIAGPAELKFNLNTTNLAPALISFERVQGSAIHSVYVTNSAAQPPPTIPTIIVPAGRTCHFFQPIGDLNDVSVTVISGANTVPNLELSGGEEFAGPVSLLLGYIPGSIRGEPDGAIVSYYFNEDSIVLPELKLVTAPTGSFGLTVEKSTDLTHWHPVAVQTTSSDRQAYYRLRLTR